ncbi:MAG: response regulator transcription factor [Bacteroidota bacterium]
MIRILLADGQTLFCQGIKSLLQNNSDFELVDFTSDFKEIAQKIESTKADILVLDYDSVFNFNFEQFSKLIKQHNKLKFCILTSNQNKESVSKILKLGTKNFISKSCNFEELLSALLATSKKEKYFSDFVLDILLDKNTRNTEEEAKGNLTNKEIEIIRLLAQGLTTKDIAQQLFISHHTVNTHRKNILAKVQMKNTSELVTYAYKNGLIEALEYYI